MGQVKHDDYQAESWMMKVARYIKCEGQQIHGFLQLMGLLDLEMETLPLHLKCNSGI